MIFFGRRVLGFPGNEMKLNKCCCCVDLRTGVKIIANIGICGVMLGLILHSVYGGGWFIGNGLGWETIVGFIAAVTVNGCLLFSTDDTNATKYNKIAIIIYLVGKTIAIILLLLLVIIGIFSICNTTNQGCSLNNILRGSKDDAYLLAIAFVTCYMIGIVVEIYFWVCVYSFYQTLKEGNSETLRNV